MQVTFLVGGGLITAYFALDFIAGSLEIQGGALGAAILAGVGAGIYSDLETACNELVRKKDVAQPDMAANGEYAKFFTLYKDLYKTLFSSFKDLKNI